VWYSRHSTKEENVLTISEATTMSCLLLFDCLLVTRCNPSETSCFIFRELVYTIACYTPSYIPQQHTTNSTENVSVIHFISFHFIPFHFMSINFCMPLFIILECMLHICEPASQWWGCMYVCYSSSRSFHQI